MLWQFVAGVATAVLVVLAGLLLAVALSGPVIEALRRRKIPRAASSVAIVFSILATLGLGGYLSLPVLAEQTWQLVSALPYAFSQLASLSERLAEQYRAADRRR